jgi:hypothetical protein
MNLGKWIPSIAPSRPENPSARWLQPDENRWRLPVLDCTQYANGMTSFTGSPEVAKKYSDLRAASGKELLRVDFNAQRVTCNLTYKINKCPPDGPVFKSRVMEEKWDIYLYEEHLFFCRSWSGELVYRVAAICELPELRICELERTSQVPEKLAVQQIDFLVKSYLMLATALHPLFPDLGQDEEKQALQSFSTYGNKGLYGTLEETVGTPYYWDRRPLL